MDFKMAAKMCKKVIRAKQFSVFLKKDFKRTKVFCAI